jgi:myo-inositol catabolism protein IolS
LKKGTTAAAIACSTKDVYPHVQQALAALRPIAEKKGITMAQLALAWVIARPGVCAIAGARNARQTADNANAADGLPDGGRTG